MLAAAGALGACNPGGRAGIGEARGAGRDASESAYRPPPSLTVAAWLPGGRVALAGRATAGSRVRIAAPGGDAVLARANGGGAWRAVLPGAPDVRLFGLSMIEAGRGVQAQGYLAVTPRGMAAQLRAGAGAVVMGAPPGIPRILAVDFDRKGGTVVSGMGPPMTALKVRIDGRERAEARVDGAGRFSLPLDEPLGPGAHELEVGQGGARDAARVAVSPAAPLTLAPFAAARALSGWRIDWMTPGGGVQTTLLIGPPEPAG